MVMPKEVSSKLIQVQLQQTVCVHVRVASNLSTSTSPVIAEVRTIMAGRAAYRNLRRSAKLLFKNDLYAEKASYLQLREEFYKNASVSESKLLKNLLKDANEANEMLQFNLVQGRLNERGNYEVKLSNEHQVTVEAGQDSPHGPELEPIDTSVIGKPITIQKVSGSKT
eukprot:gene11862-24855_t